MGDIKQRPWIGKQSDGRWKVQDLREDLKKDPSMRIAWVANLAMAYQDSFDWYVKKNPGVVLTRKDLHNIANTAAEHFIDLLCKD